MDWIERILIALFIIVASIGSSVVVFESLSSRLKSLEAATYSAQQPRYAIPPIADTGTMTIRFTGNFYFDTSNVNIVRR